MKPPVNKQLHLLRTSFAKRPKARVSAFLQNRGRRATISHVLMIAGL